MDKVEFKILINRLDNIIELLRENNRLTDIANKTVAAWRGEDHVYHEKTLDTLKHD